MTKDQFNDFINTYELYSFDDLIEITHVDGLIHQGIWMSSTPPLDESIDGKFAGKGEYEIFYLFESDRFVIWSIDEVTNLNFLQKGYLKGLPYQLAL